ncbi:hypothetical protein MMC28_000379 [Mycoblastus sanguinarius]|nr:hypothetical protein [Mycoblastus sanguinarius]
MASIFTFEPDPPKVDSPWPLASNVVTNPYSRDGISILAGTETPPAALLADCGITKLEAEPQEGPTEYKLHLLLRPRRIFSSISTVQKVSGSYLSKSRAPQPHSKMEKPNSGIGKPPSEIGIKPRISSPVQAPNSLSRQNRLQHLTTQLLWRLQQSSPHHSSSKSNLSLPVLPEADVKLSASKGPGKLIQGLEESCGALYEIGVSDDGTLVGLAIDELEESLDVLRAMAFSLGCGVQILRLIIVGDCQWTEELNTATKLTSRSRKEKLYVTEVLVAPYLRSAISVADQTTLSPDTASSIVAKRDNNEAQISEIQPQSEQLRVSLTGSTTSGKSSLLGTLSTSTLDNGRGKSRLSLLKHRHEIVSGVTSSLAQELIGYQDMVSSNNASISHSNVINYASGNVSSWNDIHSASDQGRLVFVTDSAGHPRYRRTTVRGLVSWAPHWTLCCVAADDDEDSKGKIGATASSSEILGTAGLGVDLSKAHLELCLKLDLPLIVIITKLDIASKLGLRQTLTKVLSTLKSAGRKPTILSTSSNEGKDAQLQSIAKNDEDAVRKMVASVRPNELHLVVPIVLTSAVTGSGISRLHALLRHLPTDTQRISGIPNLTLQDVAEVRNLFQIDEVFTMPENQAVHAVNGHRFALGFILSGYLPYGTLEIGDQLLIGPFISDTLNESASSPDVHRASSYPGLVKGSPRASTMQNRRRPSSGDFSNINDEIGISPSASQAWQQICVASLRNLRLPVRKLSAGQVGTVAITFQAPGSSTSNSLPRAANPSVRRGMVLITAPKDPLSGPPPAYSRFTAVFKEPSLPAWPGVLVVIYFASSRANAKIVEVKALETMPRTDEVFNFDDNESDNSASATTETLTNSQQTEITFEFVTSQEWMELGSQVLVTPGGGPSLTGQPEQREIGSAGLDGFVGIITQASVS